MFIAYLKVIYQPQKSQELKAEFKVNIGCREVQISFGFQFYELFLQKNQLKETFGFFLLCRKSIHQL